MKTTTTKICRVCGKEKPISEFGKNSQYKDGLDSRCKDCRNAYARGCAQTAKHPFLPDIKSNPALSNFTPRELIEELRARGYKGTLTFTKQIVL
jgi:hypothetical protein